ncbi:hypothetical protein E4T56_gene4971 [Termitomyces sp. T112]|nr:hypothetical protein E4T56_gene4971 [Termitomyces sp. T112]
MLCLVRITSYRCGHEDVIRRMKRTDLTVGDRRTDQCAREPGSHSSRSLFPTFDDAKTTHKHGRKSQAWGVVENKKSFATENKKRRQHYMRICTTLTKLHSTCFGRLRGPLSTTQPSSPGPTAREHERDRTPLSPGTSAPNNMERHNLVAPDFANISPGQHEETLSGRARWGNMIQTLVWQVQALHE